MKKILIVDDEPKITDAFRLLFESDYEVAMAHSGREAVELLGTCRPDLVVLDWRLNSELEGRDVLIHLKTRYPEIPVVVVTASIHFVKEIEALEPAALELKPSPGLKHKIRELCPP